MAFLEDVGRAKPATAIQDFMIGQGKLAGQRQERAVRDLQLNRVKQEMDIKNRQIEKAEAEELAANAPKAVEPFLTKFEGGSESPMAKMVYDMAVSEGLVDLSQGGLGTINQKTGAMIVEKISDPIFASKLSRTRVDYWRNLNVQALQALHQKPDDPKIQAEVQRTTDGLNQSLGQDKALSEFQKQEFETSEREAEQEFETSERKADQEFEASQKDVTDRTLPTPTDIDDFVADAEIVFKENNPKATPAQIAKFRNESRLKFKRAQAEEVSKTRAAEKIVDLEFLPQIKKNERLATRLAEIQTASQLAKAEGKITPEQKINNAKTRMSGNLSKLVDHYINLDSAGAILNVDNTSFENVIAALRSSDVGQQTGRIFGTNEQSIRNSIRKLKPLLIQDIRQSTDMGARGLDSEKELEFYLQAATDEKTDIQSNIAAIVVLDEAFGEGKVATELRGLTDESLIRRISDEGSIILQGGRDIEKPASEKTDDELKASLGI